MLYCTILYCTICIITLDSEGFLHKQATSSHLLHTVTLDTAGSHHRSNYLRCYCLRVSFKINKPFSGSARARVHTHTHTHVLLFQQFFTTRLQAQLRCYCTVRPVQYNVTDTHYTISLRTLLVQTTYALPLFVHDIQFLMDLDLLKMRTSCSIARSRTHTHTHTTHTTTQHAHTHTHKHTQHARTHTPHIHNTHHARTHTHACTRSVVSPNNGLWVTAPCQPGKSNRHFVCTFCRLCRGMRCAVFALLYVSISTLNTRKYTN